MNSLALFLTVFVACAVEAVEALTIVLAAGLTREWRSTFQGMAAALAVLAVTVAVLGPALTLVPLTGLRLVVGALLLVFGLQWLRKAILRASGRKALHDEDKIFAAQLAAGVTREWRSTLQGMAAALAVLAVTVAVLGPALTLLPLTWLRLFVGALLAVFGLQWLRKAILRASGYKDLHDEGAIYARQVAAANAAGRQARGGVRDWYAFTLSFKGVLLEGLEVVFIAITFGSNQQNLGLAAAGAVAAVLVVAAVGVAVRAPLSRVPENTMKFAVGIMLTSFGVFWGAEGAGVSWPGNDAALLVVIPATALVALGYVALLRRARSTSRATPAPVERSAA